ncbi:MAG TPA: DUF3168 domain-containing protein [Allosphingosinicella sp.]|jgi:hypothetical protein
MPEAASAVEAATFAALSGNDALTALAAVYQHVPEDTPPPVVVIADISEDPGGLLGKDGGGDVQLALTVASVIQGHARKPLFDIEEQVKRSLAEHREVRDGWSLTFLFAGSEGQLMEDGQTYVGNCRFTVFALADD